MKKVGLLFVFLLFSWSAGAQSAGPDMTDKLEKLGNPYAKRWGGGPPAYARNIWVMQEYQRKIYLGAGNSSNGGPMPNCGPIPIIAFDPEKKTFETEWTVPDEQIDVYRVFSDGLYIPGHDPKEDWTLGNFYRKKKDGSWEKVRTMPNGVHNYDMAELDKKIFCAGYGIFESTDRGATMKNAGGTAGRAYAFLPFKNNLYAAGTTSLEVPKKKGKFSSNAGVAIYNKTKNRFETAGMSRDDLFPDTVSEGNPEGHSGKVYRPTPFKNILLYLGGYVHNDHQVKPFAAYTATEKKRGFSAKRISLPKGAVPWDLKARDGKVLLLFATPDGENMVNHVWISPNGTSFKPLLSFKATTFARSMEYFNGYLYFGMGTEIKNSGKHQGNNLVVEWDVKELKPESGEIYRIPVKL